MSTLAVEMEASPQNLCVVAELPVWSTPAKFNAILNDQRRSVRIGLSMCCCLIVEAKAAGLWCK